MTAISKRLKTRRERNRELARIDSLNRCAICRRALPEKGVRMLWDDPRKFCSDACRAGAEERMK